MFHLLCAFWYLQSKYFLSFQGYYCDLRLGPANASSLWPCPKGHYCPAGTALPNQHPCPVGSFNPRERTDSPAGCIPCPAGHYCSSTGLSGPTGKKYKNLFSCLPSGCINVLWCYSTHRAVPCWIFLQGRSVLPQPTWWTFGISVSTWSLLLLRFLIDMQALPVLLYCPWLKCTRF